MAWIETEAGEHVNLATAQCIGTSDGGSYFVVDRGGKSHKLPKYLDELSYLLAPAVPGSGVLHCIHYDPAPGPGEPDSCWVETHPIVAWRVTGDTALPVAPGIKLPGWGSGLMWRHRMVLVEMPDGAFEEICEDGERYKSLELARDAMMKRGRVASK